MTALICVPLGLQTGFLRFTVPRLSALKMTGVLVACFLFPALAEELCFRVMPLAHASEQSALNIQILWGVLSLFAYVLYHPLNGATLYRRSLPTMTNPVFLFSTVTLGVACSISYWQSGSIWTAVAIHWTVVVTWLLLLGGYARLKFPQEGVENS